MRTVPRLALFSALLAVGILTFFLRADPTSEGEGPAAPQRPAWEGGDPAQLAGRSVEETANPDLPRSVLPAPPAPEETGVLLVRAVVGGTEVPVAGVEVVLTAVVLSCESFTMSSMDFLKNNVGYFNIVI